MTATPTRTSHPGELDFRSRAPLFREAASRVFDLVVIGGGITGAGVARAAAARGLSVALVEAHDLASGTSSRSSKMIHGGVRYLAQGDLALVREAASERQILRRIAPHLTRATPFVLPTRSTAGLTKFRAAMWTFEKLGQVPPEERHQVWSRDELLEREPIAVGERTNGGVAYLEFLTDDARLTLANARSAAADGAVVLTHAPVREILLEGGKAFGVRCESTLEGEDEGAEIRGRQIVNAAGPWVDAIRALEGPDIAGRLSLTKGIHLVVPHDRLPLRHTLLMNAADGRPVFAVPRGDVTYLGTTDTFHPESDLWPQIEEDDVRYLLDAAAQSFAIPRLEEADVITSWTGIRPLVAEAGKKPSEISRRDEVWTGPGGVLSIAGGKLTAYRAMAERLVDGIARSLGAGAAAQGASDAPLAGGDYAPRPPEGHALDVRARPDRLLELYGSEADGVREDGGDVAAEVRQAVLREGALRLEDYWVRRSARAFFDADAGLSSLEPASREMAHLLGWSEARREAECAHCRERHETNNARFIEARANAPVRNTA